MIYVVVGGGIAGVSCSKKLLEYTNLDMNVILISSSQHVKTISNWVRVGQFTEYFEVKEGKLLLNDRRFTFIQSTVIDWNASTKELFLSNGSCVTYDKLCIATGALPRTQWMHPRVITIRDTDSAVRLQDELSNAKSVVVVGNGGIATEVVFEIKNVELTWIIRDDSISTTFFDPSISTFFEKKLNEGRIEGFKNDGILKREKYIVDREDICRQGCALGPDWNTVVSLNGAGKTHQVTVMRKAEVKEMVFKEKSVVLVLSTGQSVECDLVVWATGVNPSSELWSSNASELKLSPIDGGILVDEAMQTSILDVYACGDVCSVQWKNRSESWKQMRLWSQARQMGDYCARSMLSNGSIELDFCFEIFAHVTTFFGYKIVLLGDFKAERQPIGWYAIERVIDDDQYVRCIMLEHRVVGAILVGETNLEETVENLILNRTNLERIEENFLDPEVDIEDFFD